MRVHLEAASRQMGRAHPDLIGPPLPDLAAHVWRWFLELDAARGAGGFGPEAIRFADIDAWQRLTGARPRRHEIDWLLQLDRLARRLRADNAKEHP